MITHKGTTVIETDRLILRPFRSEDAPSALKNWAGDPDIYRYISLSPHTLDSISEWLATAAEAYADMETYYWAIVQRESSEVIGEIFIDDFSSRNRWCELDWKVGANYQRKGYATEAAMAVIRYMYILGFHRIQAKCVAENTASQRVMQKLGMQPEGTLRDYFLGKDLQFHDVIMYSLIL